jgi:hypothetical protein
VGCCSQRKLKSFQPGLGIWVGLISKKAVEVSKWRGDSNESKSIGFGGWGQKGLALVKIIK